MKHGPEPPTGQGTPMTFRRYLHPTHAPGSRYGPDQPRVLGFSSRWSGRRNTDGPLLTDSPL